MVARRKLNPKILFLHAGWAREYRGARDDVPLGKFGYINDGNDDMGEATNFRNYGGSCFGYAPHHEINLQRLGGTAEADHVKGVLVIWTATNPDGSGRYIVGWYKNATVFSGLRNLRPDAARPAILTKALRADCHLVPVDKRTFFIPRLVKGWPGVASAFYASESLSSADIEKLMAYIAGSKSAGFYDGAKPTAPGKGGNGWPSIDPIQRAKIEKAAVATTRAHYEALGWAVESVEKDNFGWDLNVSFGARLLLVEVKGRGGEGSVELTPNEYLAMTDKKLRMAYRLAVVFSALSASPKLKIFEYAPGQKNWVSDNGEILKMRLMTSAIASF
jgi:hypothetical protein